MTHETRCKSQLYSIMRSRLDMCAYKWHHYHQEHISLILQLLLVLFPLQKSQSIHTWVPKNTKRDGNLHNLTLA